MREPAIRFVAAANQPHDSRRWIFATAILAAALIGAAAGILNSQGAY
jgi:hypothetical protein